MGEINWVPRAHLAPILPWSSGPSGHRSPSCEKGHRAKFLLDNGSRKESRWPDGQMANYVQMTFEGDPFLFPKPFPLTTLTSHWPRKKTKKTRCRGLDNYFKAAVCLILGSNTPPPPPHAPAPPAWGGVGGVFEPSIKQTAALK